MILKGIKKIGVENGVTLDVYTSCWKEATNSLLIGETE